MCNTSELGGRLRLGNTGLINFVRGKSSWIANLRVSRYVAGVGRMLLNNNARAAFYKFLDDDSCPDFESGNRSNEQVSSSLHDMISIKTIRSVSYTGSLDIIVSKFATRVGDLCP